MNTLILHGTDRDKIETLTMGPPFGHVEGFTDTGDSPGAYFNQFYSTVLDADRLMIADNVINNPAGRIAKYFGQVSASELIIFDEEYQPVSHVKNIDDFLHEISDES